MDTTGLGITNEHYLENKSNAIVNEGLSDDLKILEIAFQRFNEEFFEGKLNTSVVNISSNMRSMVKATSKEDWIKRQGGSADISEQCLGIELSQKVLELPKEEVYKYLLIGMLYQYDLERKEFYKVNGEKYKSLVTREFNYHTKAFVNMCEQCALSVSDYKDGKCTITVTEEFREILKKYGLDNMNLTCYRKEDKKDKDKNKRTGSMRLYKCPCCGTHIRATRDNLKIKCYNEESCNGAEYEQIN